ncbi:MAG TPA: DsbA family oxidoreductase [Burkholderiaceae bacterium]|jgi:predicted DsbA family dithiol-disulfide isomerase|nr:DsbA family oxidoreductase [Burkholderiaceae bacterium]
MTPQLKIDFVSDVACPWCAVGLNALERAVEALAGEVQVELHFQPFELNPSMAPEGEDATEHLSRKYGLPPAQLDRNRQAIRERGAAVGFEFGERARVWNTFDAHRLLHWAGLHGRQRELKHALLKAYHTHAQNPGAHDVLLRLAGEVGLDVEAARAVLESDQFSREVRELEARYQGLGIHSVPSVIVNDRHLIQGAHPKEAFEQALRQIAAESSAG